MLREGLYGLTYRAELNGSTDGDDALAFLRRNGEILGSDRRGGVFTGLCRFDVERGLSVVSVEVRVPPAGVLVTGFAADETGQGATVEIVSAFAGSEPKVTTTVDVAGRPMQLELTYLGPLPD